MTNSRANTTNVPVAGAPPRKDLKPRCRNGPPIADQSPTRRSEEELRCSEQNLRVIIENTPEYIKTLSRDGTIVSMNQAGLSLVEAESSDAVHDRSVFDVISPEFRDAFCSMHERVCAGEKRELKRNTMTR